MTEKEWKSNWSASRLLPTARKQLQGYKRTWWGRKYRLAGCGCYRLVWERLSDEVLRAAVLTAEDYADGKCSTTTLDAARSDVIRQSHWLRTPHVEGCIDLLDRDARTAALGVDLAINKFTWFQDVELRPVSWSVDDSTRRRDLELSRRESQERWRLHHVALSRHGDVFRDVFGNPFRAVTFDPGWRTETAVALARAAYESRDFSVLPILADALQDAGCDTEDVLNHCRDQKHVHARGCWVVDHLLEKQGGSL